MYLLYLDASGTDEAKDRNSKHYVLLGLCMREGTWFGIEKRIRALKRQYVFPDGDADLFELHVKQFSVTIKEQEEVPDFGNLSWADRRSHVREIRDRKVKAETDKKTRKKRKKKYRETDPFVHLTRQERSRLLEDAVDIIAGHDKIRLFAEAVSKSHPLVTNGQYETVPKAFEQVVSRFDTFLQKKDSWKLRGGNPRPPLDCGLLILDRDSSTETMIERLFRDFREKGHSFGALSHVIDVPFFASSAKVSGLQFADVAAFVVRRYFATGAKSGSHEERLFQKLFPRFDRDGFGKLHGIRHYVATNTCQCIVCQARGHAAGSSSEGMPSATKE